MELAPGTRVIVDQNEPMTAPYVTCVTNGCMADYEANVDLIGKMKKGQGLVIQAISTTGQPINLVMPLADFAKAYDGPPTDPKVFDEQKKLRRSCSAALTKRARNWKASKGRPPLRPLRRQQTVRRNRLEGLIPEARTLAARRQVVTWRGIP